MRTVSVYKTTTIRIAHMRYNSTKANSNMKSGTNGHSVVLDMILVCRLILVNALAYCMVSVLKFFLFFIKRERTLSYKVLDQTMKVLSNPIHIISFVVSGFLCELLLRNDIEQNPGPQIERIVLRWMKDIGKDEIRCACCYGTILSRVEQIVSPHVIRNHYYIGDDLLVEFECFHPYRETDDIELLNFDSYVSVENGFWCMENDLWLDFIGGIKCKFCDKYIMKPFNLQFEDEHHEYLDTYSGSGHDVAIRCNNNRHKRCFTTIKLMHDVELNPGPYNTEDMAVSAMLSVLQGNYRDFVSVMEGVMNNCSNKKRKRIEYALKSLKEPRAQMFGSMFSLPSINMNVTLPDETKNFVKECASATKDFVSDFGKPEINAIKIDTSSFSSVSALLSDNKTRAYCVTIMFVMLLLLRYKYPGNATVNMITLALCCLVLFTDVCPFIKSYCAQWGFMGATAQSGDNIIKIGVEAISLGLFSKQMSFNSLYDFGSRMKEIDMHSSSFAKYLTRVKDLVIAIVSEVSLWLGYDINLGSSSYNNRISLLLKDFYGIKSDYERNNSKMSVLLSARIRELERQRIQLEKDVGSTIENSQVRSVLRSISSNLNPLIRAAEAEDLRGTRPEPFNITITGLPGVGKTILTDVICSRLAAVFMDKSELIDFKAKKSAYKYTTTRGSKFWDGYTNKTRFVIWPDAWAAKDSPGVISEAADMINFFSSESFVINMSDVAEKGQYTASNCVAGLIFTNHTRVCEAMITTMNKMGPLVRRLFSAEFVLKKEWRVHENKPTLHHQKWCEYVLQHKRMPDYADVYLTEMKNGTRISGKLTLNEYLDLICEKFAEKMSSGQTHSKAVDLYTDYILDSAIGKMQSGEIDSDEEYDSVDEFLDEKKNLYMDADFYDPELHFNKDCSRDHCFRSELYACKKCGPLARNYDYETHGRLGVPFRVMNPKDPNGFATAFAQVDIFELERTQAIADIKNRCHLELLSDQLQLKSIHDYVKKYVMDCHIAGEKIPLMGYPYYKGDEDHYIHNLLNRSALVDLTEMLKLNLKDNMWIYYYRAYEYGKSFKTVIMDATNYAVKRFQVEMDLMWQYPALWFIKHPFVGLAAVGLGVGVLAKIAYTILDYFTSSEVEPVKMPKAIMQMAISKPHVGDFVKARIENMVDLQWEYHVLVNGVLHKYVKWRVKGLCLGGTSILTVHHFIKQGDALRKCNGFQKLLLGVRDFRITGEDNFKTFLYLGNNTMSDCVLDQSERGKELWKKDLCVLNLSNNFPSKPHIVQYMASAKHASFWKYMREYSTPLLWVSKYNDMTCMKETTCHYSGALTYACVESYIKNEYDGSLITIPRQELTIPDNVFAIDESTLDGSCGSIGLTHGTQFMRFINDDKVFQNPVITYFHVAIHNANGMGVMLNREMFEHISGAWKDKVTDLRSRFMDCIHDMEESFKPLGINQMSCDPEIEVGSVPYFEGYHPVYLSLPGISSGGKSQISKSEFYYDLPKQKVPSKLYGYYKDNIFFSPLNNARLPYGSNYSSIPYQTIRSINKFISAYFMDKFRIEGLSMEKRRLTIEEAILGIPGTSLRGIRKDSSPGFMLNMLKKQLVDLGVIKKNQKGKTFIFGENGPNDLENPIAKCFITFLKKQYARLENGERLINVYSDSLKDELLPPGKNTRLFCSGDVTIVILFKICFGVVIDFINTNRHRGFCMVGINPFQEWEQLYNDLIRISPNGLFIDFSKFDKKLLTCFMECFMEFSRSFYGNDDPTGNLMREMLYQDLIDSLHVTIPESDPGSPKINKSYFYKWECGNTSGNYLTAVLNSFSNFSIMTYSMICVCLGKNDLFGVPLNVVEKTFQFLMPRVSMKVYGDDIAISINQQLLDNGLDFFNLQKVISELGMEITDEVNDEAKSYTPIIQGTFIARGFKEVYLDRPYVVGPLREVSLKEPLRWYKGIKDPETKFLDIQRVLKEMALWGKEYYERNDNSPLIIELCKKRLGRYPPVIGWSENFLLACATEVYYYEDPSWVETLNSPIMDGMMQSSIITQRISKKLLLEEKAEEAVSPTTSGEQEVAVCPRPIDDDFDIVSGKSLNLKVGRMQMDNRGGSVENENKLNPIVNEVMSSTNFMEAETIQKLDFAPNKRIDNLEVRLQGIKDFLAKPYCLGVGNWAATDAAETFLEAIPIASTVASITQWAEKMKGFNLWRFTTHVRIELNASPFHQGLLLLHYVPNYNKSAQEQGNQYGNAYNYKRVCYYQHPHVELDCRDTSAEITVPYINPYTHYDKKNSLGDPGTVMLHIILPLLTGAAGTQNVDYSVFIWLSDVELTAICVPQSGRNFRRKGVKNTDEAKGPISDALTKVASAAETLNSIPVIGGLMNDVSWISRIGATLASAFGYSKPLIDSQPEVIIRNMLRNSATSTGVNQALPLGLYHDTSLKHTSEFSLNNQDECSWKFLSTIPNYINTGTWSTGQASGVELFSQSIDPLQFYTQSTWTHNAKVLTTRQGGPLWYFAHMHQYWRGSVKIRVKFAKTIYHSGKLLFTFTPGSTVAVVPDVQTSILSLRTIVDIREQDEITFDLPYQLNIPFQSVSGYSGRLSCLILNELRCPESAASDIDFVWFAFPGDDFQFAAPRINNTLTAKCVVAIPQSESKLGLVGIGEAAIKKDSTIYDEFVVGEKFLSVRQYLLKSTQLVLSAATDPFSSQQKVGINPYFIGGCTIDGTTGALSYGSHFGDALSMIAPCYVFMRGGINLNLNTNLNSHFIVSEATDDWLIASSTTMIYTSTMVAGDKATVSNTATSRFSPFMGISGADAAVGFVSVNVPYYAPCAAVPVRTSTGSSAYYTWEANNKSTLTLCSPMGNMGGTTICRSAADDFQLSFFICCPPLYVSYA